MKTTALILAMLISAAITGTAWGAGVEAETIPNAQKAIEALSYEFTFTRPPRDTRNALIIRTTDKLDRSFRFFLFRNRAPLRLGVPGYHRENLSGGALGRSFVMLSNDRRQMRPETTSLPIRSYSGSSGITKAMEDEFLDIAFAVEDAVCELSEGKPCPAL